MLRGQQQAIGHEARATDERALSCDPGQLGKIIAFREMRQNNVRCLPILAVFKESCGCLIRQVSHARKHPLLYRPGVGAVAKHLQVVVGFEQQKVQIS